MFVNTKLVILAALSFAVAQNATTSSSAPATSTSGPGIGSVPQCVLQCATNSVTSTCTSITDSCICTDTKFQEAVTQCLAAKCTAVDQAAAKSYESAVCSGTRGNASASASSAKSSASGKTNSSTTSSSTSTSNAGTQVEFGQTGLLALGIAAAGAVVGGLLV